jgi:hypothetical protein
MIAALAGGSLPFILRMVMEPEKPDIEIGTVSFKSQLDEVIKNFVQYWPIYDLPFELYTAEDEERDRQKAEEKNKEAGDSGTLDRRKQTEGSRAGSFDRGLAGDLLRHPVFDVVDEQLPANNNMNDYVDGGGGGGTHSSAPGNHVTGKGPACVDAAKGSTSEQREIGASPTRVCFSGELNDECPSEPDVDIVIYLPQKHDGVWLDQWSDLDVEDTASDVIDDKTIGDVEVFQMNDTRN